jgi:predicted transcriptional regulator
MTMLSILTDREVDLMNVLWQHGPSTVAEIHQRLQDNLAYTTVLSLMRTLESKGLVRRIKEGRAHRYSPALDRDRARGVAVKTLAGRFFRGSRELLLLHLVSPERLTPKALEQLEQLLKERKEHE